MSNLKSRCCKHSTKLVRERISTASHLPYCANTYIFRDPEAMKLHIIPMLLLFSKNINGFMKKGNGMTSLLRSIPSPRRFLYNCIPREQEPTDLKPTTMDGANDSFNVYMFGEKGEFSRDLKRAGIDLKRFFAFNILGLVIALGANFLGVTSFLLNTNPNYFRALKVDQLYSIGGFKRSIETNNKYEFTMPDNWLADQTLVLASARDRELPATFKLRKSKILRPEVAFGPPGSDGRENVSVIKSTVMPGFSLEKVLGSPKDGAENLLANVIAPPSSGKVSTLVDAYGESRDGVPMYIFEYVIQKGEKLNQHCISVVAASGTDLYTLTAMAPVSQWDSEGEKIAAVAKSFQLKY